MKIRQVEQEPSYVSLHDPHNYYFVSDLGLASSLVSVGFSVCDMNKDLISHKVQFAFQNEPELEEAVKKYWAGKLKVSARTLFDNSKMLKTRIFSM